VLRVPWMGPCSGPDGDCNGIDRAGEGKEGKVDCFPSEWRWASWWRVMLVW
jgi:hypothetical protein